MEAYFSLGDLIISQKYPTKIVEIVNIIQEQNIQTAVECKIDDGNTYSLDTLSVDTISKYGTSYKVKHLFTEKWFPIPEFENYEISNFGRIKSLKPFGNRKFEKILRWGMDWKNIREKEHKRDRSELTFSGVRLYKDGQPNFFYRRDIIEMIKGFEIVNDDNFLETYGDISTEEISRHGKDIFLFHKNYRIYGIVWDYINRLWCFSCDTAIGYDTWDDFYCFFTNYKDAQMIQNRLKCFQPRLEEKFREKEVLPPT